MKRIDLGQTITILANVGVIAGIIFLAVELRQNNELMEAAARDAQNVRLQEFVQQVYLVPGLAEIISKTRNGEPLTEVEEIKATRSSRSAVERLLSSMERGDRGDRGTSRSIKMENDIL